MHRPRRVSKHEAERRHAMRRFGERMGFGLSSETYADLSRQIQDGQAQFVRKQSNRVTIWRLMYEGKPVRVAYDKDRHQIITFIPENPVAERKDNMHPNEPKLADLNAMLKDLYTHRESVPDAEKKIKALEGQIVRKTAEVAAKIKAIEDAA